MSFAVGIMAKAEVLSAVEGASEWSSFTIEDPRFVELGDDVSALVYVTEARRPGGEDYRAVITSVYANREGEWLLVPHEQTPL